MIWADWAGIGLLAIVIIGVALLLFSGTLGPLRTPTPSDKPAYVLPSDTPAFVFPSEVGIEPPVTAAEKAFELTLKTTGFVILPLWLMLRIGDWVFGGPARRRVRQRK